MHQLISYSLFTCFLAAMYLFFVQCKRESIKYTENRLCALLSLASFVWSFCFWEVNIQIEPEAAYAFRAVGMYAVFTYLIIAQLLVCRLSGTAKSYYNPITMVSLLGFVICYFVIQKDQVTYYLTDIGMTYRFHPGFWNNVYTTYCVVISINMLASIIYMFIKTDRRSLRSLGIKLLISEFIVVFGMIFDTVLPLFGKPAIPGSTIGQFFAVLVLYNAICFVNRSRITVDNMSSYVYSSLSTPVLVYDSEYKLQIANDVAYYFVGLNEASIGNSAIDTLFCLEEKDIFDFSGPNKTLDAVCISNNIPCNLTISKIHDDYYDVVGYIIIVTDLSERMQYIDRLEQAKLEAENANSAKTIFLANMSHEIRTPMNAIIGFSELALSKDISPEIREYVEGIHLASRNLLAIINDILDITKIETGKMEIIPDNYYMAELLEDVSLIISRQAESKGLEFNMKTTGDIPSELYGDKVRLRGVLINILNNSVKYTKKGTVGFEIKVISGSEDKVKLAFIISDTGIGIRPEDKERLFQSFERLDQQLHYEVEGSGLGLAIVKGYVSLMNGDITVESEYGKGSVFTVVVEQGVVDATPLSKINAHEAVTATSSLGKLKVRDTRVLAVDDNRINLMVVKGLLNSYGIEVDMASGGAESIELCKGTHYPIVFMDRMMPEMDGVEAMRCIREIDEYYAPGGEGKIVVLTADAIRGARESLINKGFDEYLGKPVNLKQLERLLVQFLGPDKIEYKEDGGEEENLPDESAHDTPELVILKKNLPGVDVEAGIKYFGDDLSIYMSSLNDNYIYGERDLKELKEMLQNKDYESYTIRMHAIKSCYRNLGEKKVSDMAWEQEQAGREGRYEYIEEHFEEFLDAYRTLLDGMKKALGES